MKTTLLRRVALRSTILSSIVCAARSARSSERTRRRFALGAATAIVAGSTIALTPVNVEAAVYNPIPSNQFAEITYDFTEADSIFAYFTADLGGGRICIVPATQTEPSGCGESGRVIGATIGTGYTLIEARPEPGQYRLNSTNSIDTPIALGEVFTVSVCAECSRDLTDEIVADVKQAASQLAARFEGMVATHQVLEKIAGKAIGLRGVNQPVPPEDITLDLGSPGTTIVLLPSGGFFTVVDPLTVNINKGLDLLKFVSTGAALMYRGIEADPPDMNFDEVAPPQFPSGGTWTPSELQDVIDGVGEQWGYGQAALHALERFQGARVAGDLAAQIAQLEALDAMTTGAADAAVDTVAALRSWSDVAALDPELSQPALSSGERDELIPMYERVRTGGFAPAEITALQTAGFTVDEINNVQSQFIYDVSLVTPDVAYPTTMNAVADELELQVDALRALAHNARMVALRIGLDVGTANQPPVAYFTATPAGGIAPLTVSLDATASTDSDGSIVSYDWDFGDGSPTASGSTVNHTFDAGSYSIALTVTDDDGATSEFLYPIYVQAPSPPTLYLPSPHRASPGVSYPYAVIAYSQSVPITMTFTFDFGDGTAPIVGDSDLSLTVDHAYVAAGDYTLTITVIDSAGLSVTRQLEVLVAPVVADAGFDLTVAEGSPVTLGNSLTSQVDSVTSVVWDFGDGWTSYGQIPTHTYVDDGTYEARVTVTDNQVNDVATDTVIVDVTNVAPTIAGLAYTATPEVGAPASFRVFAIDPGLDDVLTTSWDFGDGSTASGTIVEHAYADAGTYVATARVWDDDGGTATAVREIHVGPRVGQRDSKGREHWLTFQSNIVAPELSLFVAGEIATNGVVEVPGLGFTVPFDVVPGTVTTVAIPIEALLLDSTLEKQPLAIHVVTDGEVTVYGLNRALATTDAYLGLPTDVLGTDHVVAAYTGSLPSQVAIVATQNATSVTISPVGGWSDGTSDPKVLHLDIGDVVQVHGPDLTASRVTADRPVAVFAGTECANIPAGYAFCDHITEQIPSSDLLGSRFVSVPLATRLLGDTIRVVATAPATVVTINGAFAATIGNGEFYETILTQSSLIETSAPALVAQYSNGSTFDGVTSDPFEMLVPPVEQYLPSYTVSTPATGFALNFVNLVAQASELTSVTIDGSVVDASLWSAVPGTSLVAAQVPIALGSHTVDASAPVGVFVYGFDSYDSYGYPGGFQLARVGAVTDLVLSPTTQSLAQGVQGCVHATIADGSGAPIADARVDHLITGANPSTGFTFTDASGSASVCWVGANAGTDTVTVSIGQLSRSGTVEWSTGSVNRAPSADDKSVSTPEDTAVGVVFSGSDPDGDVLSFSVVTPPLHGVLSGTGTSRTYTPNANFYGADFFTYRVSDGVLDSIAATVSITVTADNDAPTLTAVADQTIPEMVAFGLTVAGADPDGDALSYSLISGPSGLVVNATTGVVSWTPTEIQGPGSYLVAVKVADPDGLFATRSFAIAVTEVNRDPALDATSDRTVHPTDAVTLTAAASDPDLPANTLTYGLVSGPTGATISSTTGVFAWTASSALGEYVVTINVSDGQGGSATTSFTIHVVRDATALTLGGDTSGQYSDEATITATLRDGSSALAGQSVTISLGAASQSAITDAYGVVSATFTIPGPAATLATGASFAGTSAFAPSSQAGTFAVNREDSTIVYSGDTIGPAGATLHLSATFTDSAAGGFSGSHLESGTGATIGDITKARVAFAVYNAAACLSGSPITTLSAFVIDTGPAGDGSGTATTTWSSASEGSFCIVPSLVGATGTGSNGYYVAPPAEAAGLAVFIDASGKISGGGWIDVGDGRSTIGFNATSKSGKVKGNLVFIERTVYEGTKAMLIIKSNAIDTLRTSGSDFPITATLTGKASFKYISSIDGATLSESGNATFSATVTDTNATGGTGDSFRLLALDKTSSVLVDVTATPLAGGNIVAHLK